MKAVAAGILLGLGIAGVSVGLGQSSHTPYPGDQHAAAAEALGQLRTEWARNLKAKQVESSVAEYSPDAEFIDPAGNRFNGTSALRKLFTTVTAAYDSDLQFESKRVEASGDLAYDAGTYKETLTTRATGKQEKLSGTYLTAYRRANGVWQICEQMWGSGTGAAAPEASTLDAHPVVALTFDDLPAAGSLPPEQNRTKIVIALVAELKANHLEGTYGFVNASKLQNDPDAQQALHIWIDGGMNVGSHTWSHMSLSANSAEAFENEIALNEPALAEYAGKRDWHWFRYPFLWEGDTLEKRHAVRGYLQEHGYRVAQVTLDFEDYAWNDAYGRCSAKHDDAAINSLRQSYIDTAVEYIKLGREEQQISFGHEIPNVMLLHATAFTTLMLPDLLGLLRSEGFMLAGLPEVEKDPAYALDPDAALKYGGTLPDQFMDAKHLPYPPFKPKPFDRLKTICN
jgi:ketosteroid isomerase-like protein